VISPYYHRNRKGEEGYLEKDPAGIKYTGNITATVESGCPLGVHEGTLNNVHLVFLHNADIFPFPYNDTNPAQTMR